MSYDEYTALADEPRPAEVALPTARREDRLLTPWQMHESARWLYVSVALTLFVHGFVVAVLLRRDRASTLVTKPEATPIEVVVEPPKPPPQAPPPPKAPQPPPPQSLEKPATSAPRDANEAKVETQDLQKETHAPKAPEPPKAGRPPSESAPDTAAETKADQDKAEEDAVKADEPKADAEALDQAAPKPVPKPLPKPKPKRLAKKIPVKPRPEQDLLDQLAGASDLPDYSFARPSRKAPVGGGTEDNRYLAIVYGMIMQHRALVGIPANVGGSVTINFNVDGAGNLLSMAVARTSGYPQIDAAAASAIQRAAPFPPPPAGAPHSLIATIEFGPANSRAGDRR